MRKPEPLPYDSRSGSQAGDVLGRPAARSVWRLLRCLRGSFGTEDATSSVGVASPIHATPTELGGPGDTCGDKHDAPSGAAPAAAAARSTAGASSAHSTRTSHHVSRFTFHASRTTHHASRFTFHVSQRAFSLIEMVGVLAIIAILAAMVVPVVFRQIDQAARTRETSDLGAISNALVISILSSKSIPDGSGWPAAVASQMPLPASSITSTPRGITRYFLVDPNLSINGAGLPYPQTTNGALTPPAAGRLMILSSIATQLKTNDLVTANFTNIWNTPAGQKPTGWTWSGRGDDLRIQRMNLGPLFHRLKLIDSNPSVAGQFAIENFLPPLAVPTNGVGWDRYYLDGTFISLRDTNGVEQARHILTSDMSFVFDDGVWRGQLGAGQAPAALGSAYGIAVSNFLATLRSPGAFKGTAQDSVVMVLNLYMAAYTSWANDSPCFTPWGAAAPNQTPFWAMLQQANGSIVSTLDDVSGSTGLLK